MQNSSVPGPLRPVPVDVADARDREVLEAVVRGDRVAFDDLYRRFYPRLMEFLARLVGGREAAEEVVNDTMYTVWSSGAAFAGRSRVSTWIYGIAYKKALKRFERDRRTATESIGDGMEMISDTDVLAEADSAQMNRLLDGALAQLSPAHRSVVELTFRMDCSYDEIAEIVGCPVNTVKTRMFHARGHLRRLLGALLARRT